MTQEGHLRLSNAYGSNACNLSNSIFPGPIKQKLQANLSESFTDQDFGFWHICFHVFLSRLQMNSLFMTSSRDSATIGMPSVYRSSQGQLVQNSADNASKTIKNNKGLKTKPWWKPTSTENTFLHFYVCKINFNFACCIFIHGWN